MKKLQRGVFILIAISLYSTSSEAQFLQSILNTVKQTTQNRANSKASQTTNKALDKVDSGLQSKPNTASSSASSPADTAGINKVLGSFARAASENPNDTSAADVTMKALGILAGAGGVSAADSAAAIKSYMTARGGNGTFYQYITSTTYKQTAKKDTMSKYITNSGEGRSEMRIPIPGVVTDKMITIGHVSQPKYSVMLYADSKTYSLNIIDTALINSGGRVSTYEVTKLGLETVEGYHCIHSRLVSNSGSGLFKSSMTMDIWTSTDVPGYSLYKKMISTENVQPQMMRALEKAGCSGMLVKIDTKGKDYSSSMVLVKAEEKSFPSSMFEIPAGYTESKQNMMYHMATGAKKQ